METKIELGFFVELMLLFITLSCMTMRGASVVAQQDIAEIHKCVIENSVAVDSVVVYKVR